MIHIKELCKLNDTKKCSEAIGISKADIITREFKFLENLVNVFISLR